MKTLITGGKSAQSLKLLKAFSGDQVFLGDYGEAPSFSSPQYQFITLGALNKDIIAHNLLNTCLDLGADRLLPLYDFEVEAVAKSAVLFEEYNVHILLPHLDIVDRYPLSGAINKQNWALYDKGELIYAAIPQPALVTAGKDLNGVFYMEETGDMFNPVLFTIS